MQIHVESAILVVCPLYLTSMSLRSCLVGQSLVRVLVKDLNGVISLSKEMLEDAIFFLDVFLFFPCMFLFLYILLSCCHVPLLLCPRLICLQHLLPLLLLLQLHVLNKKKIKNEEKQREKGKIRTEGRRKRIREPREIWRQAQGLSSRVAQRPDRCIYLSSNYLQKSPYGYLKVQKAHTVL